jgi:hypothetical protein
MDFKNEKSRPKIRATSVIFENLLIVRNSPLGVSGHPGREIESEYVGFCGGFFLSDKKLPRANTCRSEI